VWPSILPDLYIFITLDGISSPLRAHCIKVTEVRFHGFLRTLSFVLQRATLSGDVPLNVRNTTGVIKFPVVDFVRERSPVVRSGGEKTQVLQDRNISYSIAAIGIQAGIISLSFHMKRDIHFCNLCLHCYHYTLSFLLPRCRMQESDYRCPDFQAAYPPPLCGELGPLDCRSVGGRSLRRFLADSHVQCGATFELNAASTGLRESAIGRQCSL
jgi:hypothetical protein